MSLLKLKLSAIVLTSQCPPGPPEAPSISGLPEISLREGDDLVLTCRSRPDGSPPTLKWFRQGEYIENQNQSVVEGASVSVSRLYLRVSRKENDVEFGCQASNGNHFPAVSQKTNFSVGLRSPLRPSEHVVTFRCTSSPAVPAST